MHCYIEQSKSTNGTNAPIENIDIYRGMPTGRTGGGKPIFTPARYVGNIAAGYVAGANGMTWTMSRIALDSYNVIQRRDGIEDPSSRNAQYYGFNIGYNRSDTYPKANVLLDSVISGIKALWNWITN